MKYAFTINRMENGFTVAERSINNTFEIPMWTFYTLEECIQFIAKEMKLKVDERPEPKPDLSGTIA